MTHLRFQPGHELDAGLAGGGDPFSAETGDTTVPPEPALDPLSQIIHDLNERHGLQLGAGDEIIQRIADSLAADAELREAAAANSFGNFALLFDEKFEEQAIDARNQSWEFFERAFGDPGLRKQLGDALAREIYGRLTGNLDWHDRLDQLELSDRERDVVGRFIEATVEALDGDLDSVWLYGSKARGESNGESDVDLLVLASEASDALRNTVADLARTTESLEGEERVVLSAKVQTRDWVAERREIEDFFIREVDRDKVVLLGSP
jgi:predicted nucleotidyltransferase